MASSGGFPRNPRLVYGFMLLASYSVLRNSVESGTDTLFKLPKSESVPDSTPLIGFAGIVPAAHKLRQL